MTFLLMVGCGIIVALVGAAIGGEEGFFAGLAIGLLTGAHFGLRRKFNDLKRELEKLRGEPRRQPQTDIEQTATTPMAAPQSRSVETQQESEPTDQPFPPASESAEVDPGLEHRPVTARQPVAPPPAYDRPEPPRAIIAIEEGVQALKRFFTTGNVVAKVGVVVLFFGVAFLLRYAMERNVFPIELRFAAVAAGAFALLVVGWRLRAERRDYALVLQGGAIGVLYLTVFAAATDDYQIIPSGLAFVLMTAFVVLSAILAVLQNAPVLAVFGTAGGFLAPVLTSTEQGSHVALFSFYALLNAGIVGIAWFKAWRILNWLGFVFTFVIGTSWGYKYYTPEHFTSTEPFLILFFLFYVAITVLFAHRQPPHLKGLVDGTLVFGVPIVGFALQAGLVRDFEFGDAYTALAMGLFYIGLAKLLWTRQVEGMRLLTESFLALGVVFGSLAIPLALDGRWTAAAWSLEAAGIVWVGLRQQRILARLFGLALQIGAAFLFLTQIQDPIGELPIINSAFVGCVLIGIAGLFTSYQLARHKQTLLDWEAPLELALLVWGLGWWLGAGLLEIGEHLPSRHELPAAMAFFSVSAVLLSTLATRVRWKNALHPSLALLPVLIILALYQFADGISRGPWRYGGHIAWAIAFIADYVLLRRYAQTWADRLTTTWHAGSVCLTAFILTWALAAAVNDVPSLGDTWVLVTCAVLPTAIMFALIAHGGRVQWPVAAFPVSYQGAGLIPIGVMLLIWVLASCWHPGDPVPLPYLPIVNPIDLSALFLVLVVLQWWRLNREAPVIGELQVAHGVVLLGVIAFVWLNAVVVRTVHHFMDVPFRAEAMWRTPALQTAITLTWTVTGCLMMAFTAARLKIREVWITGAAFLAVVVAKLFLVDLADIGTVARIVSFIGVGLLLLVIGYFAPIPPRQVESTPE